MAKQTFTTGQVLTAAQMTSLQQTAMGGGSTTAKTVSYTLVAADAGTVIQMNSASATTITVNTALFAQGDSVQIQNIGAGVCTITAGTATVNTAGSLALSQYEGGQLYFNTTSAAFFFDVVQAAASPGALVLVKARTTFTSVATTTTTFDNVFTSTYKNYLVVIDDWTGASIGNDPQLQMLYSGTTQATGYYGASLGTEYTVASVVSVGNNNATEMSFWRSIGNANGSYLSLYFSNVGSGSSEKAQFWGTGLEGDNAEMYTTGGVATVGRAYTGFLLKASTGNITGAATVYGLAIS